MSKYFQQFDVGDCPEKINFIFEYFIETLRIFFQL